MRCILCKSNYARKSVNGTNLCYKHCYREDLIKNKDWLNRYLKEQYGR
jgi:hypothetical protein